MEVIVITQLFNKYFTILINRVLLDEVVLLCLPNQLAELNPPGCQQKVDEDVLRTEGLASQHAFRQKMPGGESFPVPDFKNKRVVLLPPQLGLLTISVPFISLCLASSHLISTSSTFLSNSFSSLSDCSFKQVSNLSFS